MIRWFLSLFRRKPAAPFPSAPTVFLEPVSAADSGWSYRSHVTLGHDGRAFRYGATFEKGVGHLYRVYEFHTAKSDEKLAAYFASLARRPGFNGQA